ncbi:MAG: hypothetical protein DIZ78_13190 [endosymbiont of Escarpia spicata]|uniref:DUF6969 domain-containing protein n=1 Tax=endosymbiont of Escarpia spicata TaxID=2200908 RepID=A0A370DGX5_9GAMM|nr:MAG: hypothetical protein DIZ78_13190 [endosymbiont of Escarpia spicata]
MNSKISNIQLPTLTPPNPAQLPCGEIAEMLAAGTEVRTSMRALERVGLNLVGEVLKDQGDFIELEHYPKDDVFDDETHSQYYYHTHRDDADEHGHFHTFLRAGGMPKGAKPLDYPLASEPWPQGDDAIGHLVGISMDAWGRPIGLFAANRWVTGETWYPAETMIEMLPRFAIGHAWPSWPVNRWISVMVRLFQPHIRTLLTHRDSVISAWQQAHPGMDVFEDRNLELTGYLPISVEKWMAALKQASS